MHLQVEARTDLHGEREPVAFRLGSRHVKVMQIADRWISEDCSYFKVLTGDASTYILRYIPASLAWELTMYQAPDPFR